MQQGLPLPEKIANAPELLLGLQLYYQAFLDLTSCRTGGYQTEGPIPWINIHTWAVVNNLSAEQREDLFYFIPRMDEVYLKFKASKLKDATKPPRKVRKGK